MDFSVECYDSLTHQTLVIVAGIGLFFYTLGFPVYLFLDLYRNRKFLHNEEKQKKNNTLPQHHQVKFRLGGLYHSCEFIPV